MSLLGGVSVDTCQTSERRTKKRRRPIACNFCRSKKIRCNGDTPSPCGVCIERGREYHCTYPAQQYIRHHTRNSEGGDISKRLARIESLIKQDSGIADVGNLQSSILGSGTNVGGEVEGLIHFDSINTLTRASKVHEKAASRAFEIPLHSLHESSVSTHSFPNLLRGPSGPTGQTPRNSNGQGGCEEQYSMVITEERTQSPEVSIIGPEDMSTWEYHGPRSFMSICSKPGIQWVSRKTKSNSFSNVAHAFTTFVSQGLAMQVSDLLETSSEPNADEAWRYTKAYFEHSLDASLGIVDRQWFEEQLRAHIAGTLNSSDPSWCALRNTIFASGCRIELSIAGQYQEAVTHAWRYFQNALLLSHRLLYTRSSIIGVQALAIMAYFCQNFNTPCLEYMICSNAFRLALAKGLHREPVASWNPSNDEVNQRRSIFWGIYCLEKQIACQSGRPSAINDSNITCSLPVSGRPGSAMNIHYAQALIRITQLISAAAEVLASRQEERPLHQLVSAIFQLDRKAKELRAQLQTTIDLEKSINPNDPLQRLSFQQTVYLYSSYYSTLIYIHSPLTCPWEPTFTHCATDPSLRQRLTESSNLMADACRKALLMTEHIHFNAATPISVGLFGPLYSLINLFIYILLHGPENERSQLDLTVLDVAVGYFARMKMSTNSQISISLAKEMADLATKYVEQPARSINPKVQTNTKLDSQPLDQSAVNVTEQLLSECQPFVEFETDFFRDSLNQDLDDWGLLLLDEPVSMLE